MDIAFDKNINNILYEFYKENKITLLGSIFASILSLSVESLVLPNMTSKLLSNIDNKSVLKNNIIKILGTWTFLQMSYSVSEMINSKIEPLLTKFITDKITNSIFIKYENTHMDINTSIIFTKLLLFRTTIESLVNIIYIVFIPRIIGILLIILNFYRINKRLGIFSFVLILIQFLFIVNDMKKCIKLTFDEIENGDDIMEDISDKFENIHMISASTNGIYNEIKDCIKKSSEVLKDRMKSNECIINTRINGYILNSIVFSMIMLYVYKLYKDNEITNENIATVLLTMGTFFNSMYEITFYIPEISKKIGILKSNQKFIDELFGHKEENKNQDINFNNGLIEFQNVSFTYNGNKNIIINNFSKKINPNSITILFGPSGSGKTTFVKLILNMLKPQNGIITIDNHNINKVSKRTLKKYISYVSQTKISLFDTTIIDNLLYGITDDDNIKTKIQNLFIDYNIINIFESINKNIELTSGTYDKFNFFNYKVGKQGNLLSGGQKQMIHIIRAILNNNKIIIFDEPTTALDNMNRDNVIKMIKNKCREKTVLIITHDETIKKISDHIINFS